jgi:GT2 family glycosyltransferase
MSTLKTAPHISIILLNWNGLEDTIECLESLQNITYPNYQVILVDNASKGDDVKILRGKFSSYIHIIENDRNYGFAAGNNIGIRYALEQNADYVFLLNNDTVVDPGFLDELIGVAEPDKRVGIVCPVVYWYHRPDQIWFSGERKVNLFKGTVTPDRRMDESQPVVQTQFATGAAMLIRRETIKRVGLLPECYFFGLEDIDYSIHVLREGLAIAVVAKAKVWHKGSGSAGGIAAVRTGYQYKGWQIVRRKYLSRGGYLLATVCGLVWSAMQLLALLFGYVRRGDYKGLHTLFRKAGQALRGAIEGSFSRVRP